MSNLKAYTIGTLFPLPLIFLAPMIFNNGFIQSSLNNQAQKLFLSENINHDPSSFLMRRRGIRLFGLILFYLLTYLNFSRDHDDPEK